MKKLFLTLVALCGSAFAQGAFYQLSPAYPNATLRVCPIGSANPCPSPSSIFSDSALSQGITQPVQLGPSGSFGFYVASGQYLIQVGQPFNQSIVATIGGGGGGGTINVPGQGYFVSDGRLNGPGGIADNASAISGVANQVKVTQFVLPIAVTVTHITLTIVGVAAGTANAGIYSADGNTKLIDSGNFNANSATTQTLTVGSVTLTPGVYWFAVACSNITSTAASLQNPGGTAATPIWNNQAVRVGTAANSSAGGLPATLGAISGTAVNMPIVVFEP